MQRTSNISTSFLILFLIEKSGFVVSASVFLFLFLFFFFSFFYFWGAKFHTIANSIFLKKNFFKLRFEKNLKKSPFFNKEIGKFMGNFYFSSVRSTTFAKFFWLNLFKFSIYIYKEQKDTALYT